jgi:hypothetical protein
MGAKRYSTEQIIVKLAPDARLPRARLRSALAARAGVQGSREAGVVS